MVARGLPLKLCFSVDIMFAKVCTHGTPIADTVLTGAENTATPFSHHVSVALPFLNLWFMGLGGSTRKGGRMACSMFSHPAPPVSLKTARVGFTSNTG